MRTRQPLAVVVALATLCAAAVGCAANGIAPVQAERPAVELSPDVRRVVDAAVEQTRVTTGYDPSYVRLAYPGGDVPPETGVCTDVVIRAFRVNGVDLQKEVHEDMARNFAKYPRKWGLARPDRNIDHRRVPNLMTFFERRGKALPVMESAASYLPGDVVAWDLGTGQSHIGVVADVWDDEAGRYRIVHNIGAGARLEDVLFTWRVIGHYRFF